MTKGYSKDKDLEEAFWDDNFTGNRKKVLHRQVQQDRTFAKISSSERAKLRNK